MAEFEKPSNTEDEYFAREDIEKMRRLAKQQADQLASTERERLKALHHMRCPSCGMSLQTVALEGVHVDTCFNCHGVWLDQGELEKLRKGAGTPHPVIGAVLNWFGKR